LDGNRNIAGCLEARAEGAGNIQMEDRYTDKTSKENEYLGADGKIYPWRPKRVAIHECGHAAAAHLLGIPIQKVIVRGSQGRTSPEELLRGTAAGLCFRGISRNPADNIAISLAGMCAEVLLLDARSLKPDDIWGEGYTSDREIVQKDLEIFPYDWTLPVSTQIDDAMNTALERTTTLVLDNERQIRRMSRALLRETRLDADAITGFLGERTDDNSMTDERLSELIAAANAGRELARRLEIAA